MEDRQYDVIVIGAGPAGCRAASVLAENGRRTALVERGLPGGNCLHAGCIPTKKLSLAAARLRERLAQEGLRQEEIKQEEILQEKRVQKRSMQEKSPQEEDLSLKAGDPARISRKARQNAWEHFLEETAQTTREMTEGIRLVQMSRRVRILEGEEIFPERASQGLTVKIGGENYFAKDIVLASGSAPMIPEAVLRSMEKYPSVDFYTTNTLKEMKKLPSRLIVIGGGTAGCEIADAMTAFVPTVELYEAGEQILASWSREPQRAVRRILERHGVRVRENCQRSDNWLEEILGGTPSEEKTTEDPEADRLQDPAPVHKRTGSIQEVPAGTAVLTIVGRRPVFPAGKARALGLHLTPDGYIRADSSGRTENPHIYCIGDANGQEKTAYYGTWQAEQLILQNDIDTGESSRILPDIDMKKPLEADPIEEWERKCAPSCLHVDPPAACVGLTLEEIRTRGYIIRTGRAPVYASGAARLRGYTDGSVTVWRDTKTDLLLGACVIAPEAEEMIHLLQSYILYRIPCSLICRQVFAHPSLSELVRMAVEDACGGSPELPAKRRR